MVFDCYLLEDFLSEANMVTTVFVCALVMDKSGGFNLTQTVATAS